MEVLNYSEFRGNLTRNLNKVTEDAEVVVVSRGKGKNVVVISLDEYNSMKETMHLLSTTANRKRLDEAIQEMEGGRSNSHQIIE